MKKLFTKFIHSYGGTTAYSGNDRIMYVRGVDRIKVDASPSMQDKFINLPFKIVYQP